MAEMQIQIGAEVNGAIRGLQQVETQAGKTFQKVSQSSGAATQSMINLSRVVQDAPYGFIGIANNLNPLVESFQRLKSETGSTGGAFKALATSLTGPAGIGLAVGILSTLLVKFGDSLFGASEVSKKLAEEQKKVAEEQKNIIDGIGKENAQVQILVTQLGKENLSREQKEGILKKLNQINPVYFGDLKNEEGLINNVNAAYDKYLKSLVRRTEAAILQKDLEKLSTQILELERKGAVPLAQLPQGVSFDENRKITQENLKQLTLSTQLQTLLNEREQILSRIAEKSDIPLDLKVEKPNLDIPLLAIVELNDRIIREFEKSTQKVEAELTNLGKAVNKEYVQKVIGTIKQNPIALNIEPLDPEAIIAEKDLRQRILFLTKLFDDGKKQINQTIEELKVDSLAAFAQGIGQALSTGEIRNVFQGFVDTIASGVIAIGKQMIALGVKAALLKKALQSLFQNPVALVAAGVGLIAVGTAIRGALSKGIEGREKGGPVTGNTPYIVGERGPELFVPSVGGSIIPNNRLNSFNGRPAFAMSGGGRSIVRGSDILLSYARTQRSQSRVNG